jgi:membrane associated rhomboid family serine protease
MRRFPAAVLGLIIINAAAFLAGYASPQAHEWLRNHGAFWYTGSPHFEAWQFISYMFLHGGPSHILFNMFALYSFGVVLERQWGTARFVAFYFLCGIGAALVHNAVNLYQFSSLHQQLLAQGMTAEDIDEALSTGRSVFGLNAATRATLVDLYGIYSVPMIGASGAIYGILVAFGTLYPNAKLAMLFIPVPIAAKYFIPGLLALDLFSGITGFPLFGGGIAHFAHVGGALIGLVLMLLWRRRTARIETSTAGGFR